MEWEIKAALTGAAVLMVMAVVRWGGRRLGGLAAALPIITAPTLAWLADEGGVSFAVEVAIGSVAACATLAAFALCYARAARFGGVCTALLAGLVGAAVLVPTAHWASGRLGNALALAFGACALARRAMPHEPRVAGAFSRRTSVRSTLLVSAVAAATSAVTASLGPSIGGFATGLLSSLPLITGAVVMAEHASAGHRAAGHFLGGYVKGLFGKAVFGSVFAVLAPIQGAPLALVLGCVGAAVISALQWRPAASKPALEPATR